MIEKILTEIHQKDKKKGRKGIGERGRERERKKERDREVGIEF